MKYLFIIIYLLFLNKILLAQTLTQDEKENILEALNDSSMNYREAALSAIIKYKITDAKDSLEQKIWKDKRSLQVDYLEALYAVGSEKTHEYALAFLDTIDANPMGNSGYAPILLEQKVRATGVLFKLGDYSTYEYVFQMLDEYTSWLNCSYAVDLLPEIIKNIPTERERAKKELAKAAFHSRIDVMRFWALTQLTQLFGKETLPTILEVLETDTSTSVRGVILNQFLPTGYNDLVNKTLRRMLYNDTVATIRKQVAENLLFRHGTPSDYKFVKEYFLQESNTVTKKLIESDLEDFKPTLYEDTTISTTSMLDTLTSYTNQCYGYDWLKDEAYKTELLNKLTNAKTKLTSGDSLGCRTEVAAFQNSVAQVYADSAGSYPKYISNEGYKFLYYYAGYILDRLPRSNSNKDVNRRR